jgi:hypothetical protein
LKPSKRVHRDVSTMAVCHANMLRCWVAIAQLREVGGEMDAGFDTPLM